jgi:hypothetical protein
MCRRSYSDGFSLSIWEHIAWILTNTYAANSFFLFEFYTNLLWYFVYMLDFSPHPRYFSEIELVFTSIKSWLNCCLSYGNYNLLTTIASRILVRV